MDKNPKQELKDVLCEERWDRTKKNKKFLKKQNNKTAKKQFYKELLQNCVVLDPNFSDPKFPLHMIDTKILSDLETCAKILEVADVFKKLDLDIIVLLSRTLCLRQFTEPNEWVEESFEYARHGLLNLFFEIFIKLREKTIAGEKWPTSVLLTMLGFFNNCAIYKRTRKLLRNTENSDIISQPQFFERIFFNSKDPALCIRALRFSVRILNTKSFTQDFVQKYFNRIREILPTVQTMFEFQFEMIRSISQNILESEQGDFFLKLVSELPEEQRTKIIAEDRSRIIHPLGRVFMRCASCEKREKSKKEFQKCSRCNLVYYCSKSCQRADWPSHKNVCK